VLRFLVWGYLGSQAEGVWWSPRPYACGASLGCCSVATRGRARTIGTGRSGFAPVDGSPVGAISLLIVKPETVLRVASAGLACALVLAIKSGWNDGEERFPRNFTRYAADDCRKSALGLSLRRCAAPARKLPCGRRRGALRGIEPLHRSPTLARRHSKSRFNDAVTFNYMACYVLSDLSFGNYLEDGGWRGYAQKAAKSGFVTEAVCGSSAKKMSDAGQAYASDLRRPAHDTFAVRGPGMASSSHPCLVFDCHQWPASHARTVGARRRRSDAYVRSHACRAKSKSLRTRCGVRSTNPHVSV
jgi:hypothetical protein